MVNGRSGSSIHHLLFTRFVLMFLDRAVLYDFELAGRRLRLWKRMGESYEHVLMKALGYAMYVAEYPALEIEPRVALRYRPDLVARAREGADRFLFWGECGTASLRKTAWLLKHSGTERLVLFKIESNIEQLAEELRASIVQRYRPQGRVLLINFSAEVVSLTLERRIARVAESWYTKVVV
jgi:hypothetical protein